MATAQQPDQTPKMAASFAMQLTGDCTLAESAICLLEHIDTTGSITQAAKACGISYRSAWQTIERLQNRSERPLVTRSAGGSHGGGSTLTEEGKKMVAMFRAAEAEHRRFMALLSESMGEYEKQAKFLRRWFMKTSIRNELYGTVKEISVGAVNSEITVSIGAEDEVVAIITNDGVEELGLAVGKPVTALLKESAIFICAGEGTPKVSARNRWHGRVLRVHEGVVFAEVTVELPSKKTLTSMITFESLSQLELWSDSKVWLCCKASDVVLAAVE